MGGLNIKKDKNVFSANWEANLLVKNRLSGKLKRLRFQNYPGRLKELLEEDEEKEKNKQSEKEEILKLVAPAGESAIKIAPQQDHFLPLPAGPGQPGGAKAELHFHPEDKRQVETIASSLPKDDSKKYSLEKIISTLLVKQGLDFDEENKEKFGSIIFDFFRNRKRFLTVRELLLEAVRTRAGRLTDQKADAVLSIVKSLKVKLEAAGGLVVRLGGQVPAPLPTEVRSPPSPAPLAAERLEPEPPAEITEALQEIKKDLAIPLPAEPALKPISPPAPSSSSVAEQFPARPAQPKLNIPASGFTIPTAEKEAGALKSTPAVIPPVAPVAAKISITRPAEASVPKKAVTDVVNKKEVVFKAVPQARHVLTGPIGELEAMTLENFRRLGSDTAEIVGRIEDKIKVLEHDSFTRKTQGIEAWRRSETHQFYLQLGLECMQSGQDVSQLIDQKEQAGQKTLTREEFTAISDLNRRLRF